MYVDFIILQFILTSANLQQNMEQLSKDNKCLSSIRERLALSRGLLTFPFRIIPEKGPCEPLAAMVVTEPENSVFRVWLQEATYRLIRAVRLLVEVPELTVTFSIKLDIVVLQLS
jgi:hypothetical protein